MDHCLGALSALEKFSPQHPHSGSQWAVIPSTSGQYMHVVYFHTRRQNTHVHRIQVNKNNPTLFEFFQNGGVTRENQIRY